MIKSDDCGKTWAVGLRHRSAESQTESGWEPNMNGTFSPSDFKNIFSFLFVLPSQYVYVYVLIPSWSFVTHRGGSKIELNVGKHPVFCDAFEAEISRNHTHQQKREKRQGMRAEQYSHWPVHRVLELSSLMLHQVSWTEKIYLHLLLCLVANFDSELYYLYFIYIFTQNSKKKNLSKHFEIKIWI